MLVMSSVWSLLLPSPSASFGPLGLLIAAVKVVIACALKQTNLAQYVSEAK